MAVGSGWLRDIITSELDIQQSILTAELGSPAHPKRDTGSLCPTAKYVSPNTLIFHTKCGKTLSKNIKDSLFYTNENSLSFEDCMGQCGISRPECFAVAYNTGGLYCFFFNSTSTSDSIIGDDGGDTIYDVAFADAQQLMPPANGSCPFKNDAKYTTPNGLQFDILCNKDTGPDAGDYCADNYSSEDYKCTPHANSLEECMEICSKAHPLCKGVSWNWQMGSGFGNCYLKNNPAGATDLPYTEYSHSANVVTSSLYNIDKSCDNDNSFRTAKSNDKYDVSCYESRTGSQNITTIHAYSLDDCLNDCSNVSACKGVVFDMSLDYGYNNCYLQNYTGQADYGSNTTFALRISRDGSSGGSEAWIAGPVVGVIVLLVLLAGFGLYWRKRRARKNAYKPPPDQKREVQEKPGRRKVYEVGSGAHGQYDRRYELRDPNSEALFQHEVAQSPR